MNAEAGRPEDDDAITTPGLVCLSSVSIRFCLNSTRSGPFYNGENFRQYFITVPMAMEKGQCLEWVALPLARSQLRPTLAPRR